MDRLLNPCSLLWVKVFVSNYTKNVLRNLLEQNILAITATCMSSSWLPTLPLLQSKVPILPMQVVIFSGIYLLLHSSVAVDIYRTAYIVLYNFNRISRIVCQVFYSTESVEGLFIRRWIIDGMFIVLLFTPLQYGGWVLNCHTCGSCSRAANQIAQDTSTIWVCAFVRCVGGSEIFQLCNNAYLYSLATQWSCLLLQFLYL